MLRRLKGGAAAEANPTGASRSVQVPTQTIAIGLLILILAWLVLVPVGMVIWGSLRDAPPGTLGGGSYSWVNYLHAYQDASLLKSAWNTLVFSVGAALLSFVVGTFLAWVTERTNTPFRGVIYALVLFPLVMPGILQGIAWVLLLNPTIGVVNKIAALWLGLEGPLINGYSMAGMIWMHGIDHITLPFLLMAAAMRNMDPSLEEAALATGSSLVQTLRTITLPLLTPAMLATFLLLIIRGVETFEVPALAGIPAGIPVFATEVWLATKGRPPNYNMAAAFGVGYLLMTVVGLLLYHRATNFADRYVTVTGKGYRPTRLDLGPWRWLLAGVSLLVLTVAVLLPLFIILWSSVMPFYAVPSWAALSRLTLRNYEKVLTMDSTYAALSNNVMVGVGSALVAVLLAAVISWLVLRTKIPGRKALDLLAFAPIALPGTLFGLALIWVYLTVPIPIYGTLWLLVVAFVSKYIPYGVRATHSALSQVHRELEEASEACGAPWRRTFVNVVLPLILPGMTVGFIYILSLTFRVLSLPALLSHTNTELVALLIFDLYEHGSYPGLAALGVLMLVVLVILAGISRFLGNRFGVQEL